MNTPSGVATLTIPASSVPQWMTRLKMEPSTAVSVSTAAAIQSTNAALQVGNLNLGNVATSTTHTIYHTAPQHHHQQQQQQQHHHQQQGGTMLAQQAPATGTLQQQQQQHQQQQLLGTIDCYEDVFKEITKKLYGDDATGGVTIADVLDSSLLGNQSIVYDTSDLFRQDVISQGTNNAGALAQTNAVNSGGGGGGGLAIVAAQGSNGLPPGTILVQRRLQDDKGRIWTIEGLPHTGDQIAFAAVATADQTAAASLQQINVNPALPPPPPLQQGATLPQQTTPLPPPPSALQQNPQQHQFVTAFDERWFESDEQLTWTQSKIARYNPSQKVFRCVDCDFVGFLSRVAEHWLGNHADLRVFQCPRCPYTSAWARCVRMHLTRQHGETLADNSLWKENPVLEEVTKFLNTLKTKVEQKVEPPNPTGEKRYTCPYCPYQTDRRDLYNRHENIHRDEKPFQCYVCDKQFNRADHVKKHFIRMHREFNYDINKIKKAAAKNLLVGSTMVSSGSVSGGGSQGIQFFNGSKMAQVKNSQQQQLQFIQESQQQSISIKTEKGLTSGSGQSQIASTSVASTSHQNQSSSSSGATSQQQQQQQLPHIAYFTTNNPPPPPLSSGPGVQSQQQSQSSTTSSSTSTLPTGMAGIGGTKKEGKTKGHRKKKPHEKMYTCSYCPWQGVDNWCLKRHLNTHIKPFLCALCDYKAARSERLATHVLKVHNKRVCHKCSFLADDSESLSQHIQDSHQNPLVKTGFNCNICHEYFELRADLEAHAILEHQKVIVQCDLCDFRTTDELSMEAHLRDKHNLTPGMGAVAAAAAAAAAAAIGQSVNAQYIHSQSQQLSLPTSGATAEQILSQSTGGVINTSSTSTSSGITQNFPGGALPASSSSGVKSLVAPTPNLGHPEIPGLTVEPDEPETLCEKCGIDFLDEPSRKLHEKRHLLVTNPSLDESVIAAKGPPFKNFTRTYVCSTCSYTSATKKMMMQHQRAHTGFELVCQAEDCQFSTPFDNTLKEHIQNDHGTEDNVRCPHCALRMPTPTAFNSHWRLHHLTICSLCVNIYRVKYDVKENDIHDVICKMSPATTSSSIFLPSSSSSASSVFGSSAHNHQSEVSSVVNSSSLFKIEPLTSADFHSLPPLVDDLVGLVGMPDLVDDEEPLMKKPKLETQPQFLSSTQTLYKRESISFLPRLVEVIVAPMPPKIKRNKFSKRRSLRRRKKRKMRKTNDNIPDNYHHHFLEGSSSSSHYPTVSSDPKNLAPVKNNKLVNTLLKLLQIRENSQKITTINRVSLRRRYCQKGTFSWLYRNPREGFKCCNNLCENKMSWRYPRKVGLILHKLWYHRWLPRFKCDICGLQFPHLYQAFLHKITKHSSTSTTTTQVVSKVDNNKQLNISQEEDNGSHHHNHHLFLQQQQNQQTLVQVAAAQLHHQNIRQFNPPTQQLAVSAAPTMITGD